jgi:hypothetical protein
MKPITKTKRLAVLAALIVLVGWFAIKWWITPTLLSLRDLPGITSETLEAQGTLFRIQEPFLFARSTGMGVFVVEILSAQNFGGETHLVFGGDAKSLESFVNEIRFVNAGAGLAGAAIGGAWDGISSLCTGLLDIVQHPIDTASSVAAGVSSAAEYAWGTSVSAMKEDAQKLAKAFYCDKAAQISEKHGMDYFDIKTEHAKQAIYSEVNSSLAGRGAAELALLVAPFAVVGKGGKVARAVSVAGDATKGGRIPKEAVEFATAGRIFPETVEKMVATLKRLKSAVPPRRFAPPPLAAFGKAVSSDYRTTFLEAHKNIDAAQVVVHHAVEQQARTRYPGIVTEAEIHSLENLRGIPKALDATLHKADIAREWNEFYRLNPVSMMTKDKLLQKATEIDRKFGHLFTPQLL